MAAWMKERQQEKVLAAAETCRSIGVSALGRRSLSFMPSSSLTSFCHFPLL